MRVKRTVRKFYWKMEDRGCFPGSDCEFDKIVAYHDMKIENVPDELKEIAKIFKVM